MADTRMTQSLLRWEQAEVLRSSTEAARVAGGLRPATPDVLRRYLAPPASTVFPLEYAYYLVGDVAGADVLDLGCGTGENASILAARGARVVAMDISPDLLALALRRAHLGGVTDAVTCVCGSAHAIPLPSESVDLVFGNAILHHLDLDLAARELYRVLKPGGRAVFKEPIRNSALVVWLRSLFPSTDPDISPYERPLQWDDITRLARGFHVGRFRPFRLPVVALAHTMRMPDRTVTRLRHWEDGWLDRWPQLADFAGVGVFELTRPGAAAPSSPSGV